jgi:Fur family transcriptional regulator, peroxide stress response regulator
MANGRATRQKEAVFRAARTSGEHPTAEMIFETVRRELPRISLGTVYRNLQRLVADGKLSMAPVGDRSARFDPMTDPHDHFVCEGCGRIFDVMREQGAAVTFRSLRSRGFEIRSHALSVYGACPACVRSGWKAAAPKEERV